MRAPDKGFEMDKGRLPESQVDVGNRLEGDDSAMPLADGVQSLPRRLRALIDIPTLVRMLCEVTMCEVIDAQAKRFRRTRERRGTVTVSVI